MPDPYDQQVMWILRQNQLTPQQLTQQYKGYKDERAAFEAGHGTVEEMAASLTPGVAAMLDLEDKMLADLTVAPPVAPPVVEPMYTFSTGHHFHVDTAAWLTIMAICNLILAIVWVLINF